MVTNHADAQLSPQDTLYQTVVRLDSLYFAAYNTCDMKTQSELIAKNIEFYHDSGGLITSKKKLLKAIEQNICGKVTRELIAGSIEVHEIPGWGAIEMGLHQFHNNQEPDVVPRPGKFIVFWQKTNDGWVMVKVVSLH